MQSREQQRMAWECQHFYKPGIIMSMAWFGHIQFSLGQCRP